MAETIPHSCAYLMAPYDASHTVGGPSNSSSSWSKILNETHNSSLNLREWGTVIPTIIENQCETNSRDKKIPIVLGGDHSLTYFSIRGLLRVFGEFDVVHFDAHHDRYDTPNFLTHYNVIRLIEDQLNCFVHSIGNRYQQEAVEILTPKCKTKKIYVTVDADFFDPSLVPNVAAPVAPSEKLNSRPNLETFSTILHELKGQIIGADIVEWCGAQSGSEEFRFMAEVRSELAYAALNSWKK